MAGIKGSKESRPLDGPWKPKSARADPAVGVISLIYVPPLPALA
jgi:hypothetical protein